MARGILHRLRHGAGAIGACATLAGAALALPPGFQKTTVFTGLGEPVAIGFLPDGRPIIAERPGTVVIINGPSKSTVFQITDITFWEESGVLGMCLDPDFAANGYVYVLYTSAASEGRIGRFTVIDDVSDPASEAIVWRNPQPCDAGSHHGGGMGFGLDGRLYISTGEEFQSQWAMDLSSQRGKVLRINKDGSVPADNPFVGTPGADPAIWSIGMRNPFRLSFHPENGRLYAGDVGFFSWEEVDLIRPGLNYGWPNMEGPLCYISDCAPYAAPVWSYPQRDPVLTPEGSAVIVGPVYCGATFPSEYCGNLFVADHVNGWIRRLVLDADGGVVSTEEFDRSPELQTVVDLKVGPDGALYYTSIFVGVPGGQSLFKIQYTGSNQPPVPVAKAVPVQGLPPLLVKFNGTESYDPDSAPGPLTYEWDFGDGSAPATGPRATHVYTAWGRHHATLKVSDGSLSATSAPLSITVGHAPQPEILTPPEDTVYRAGDTIQFSGRAFDADDGPMPASSMSWTVVLLHETHVHPVLGPLDGVDHGAFIVPDRGHTPEHTAYRISLTATDVDLIPTTVSREVDPVISALSFDTQPGGIPVFLDNLPLATPITYESIVNFNHTVSAQLSYLLAGQPYHFTGWSSGMGRVFDVVAPEGGLSLTATYAPGCAADINGDDFVDGIDYDTFFGWFESGDPLADINHDGFVDGIDSDDFSAVFEAGC